MSLVNTAIEKLAYDPTRALHAILKMPAHKLQLGMQAIERHSDTLRPEHYHNVMGLKHMLGGALHERNMLDKVRDWVPKPAAPAAMSAEGVRELVKKLPGPHHQGFLSGAKSFVGRHPMETMLGVYLGGALLLAHAAGRRAQRERKEERDRRWEAKMQSKSLAKAASMRMVKHYIAGEITGEALRRHVTAKQNARFARRLASHPSSTHETQHDVRGPNEPPEQVGH
jgi:hypothetical protein